MFRFKGEIEFDALTVPAVAPAMASYGDHRELAAPGLTLRWDARHVDVALRNGLLALAAGRARDAKTERSSEALRWLDRYERSGECAADDVGGGFSIVIVDFAKQKALLWVDRFGIEALCYRSTRGTLAFADGACNVPGAATTIDAQSLFEYLYFHVVPAPATIYQEVLRLEAAHRLTASAAIAKPSCYWKPRFIENDRSDLLARSDRFVELIREAVEQEADDESTACFLSGGTDSSTIAGMLMQMRGGPAHAYSIGFDAAGYDEMAYARIAARHYGLSHDEYYVTPTDVVEAMPLLAASFDQPFGNSSVLPAYLCAARARRDGFTRMLAGDGGDELFGGNSRYAVQKAFEVYHCLPHTLRRSVLEPAASNITLFRTLPGLRQLGGYVRHARPDLPDRLNAFNLLQYVGIDDLLEPTLRARIDPAAPLARQRDVWAHSSARALVNRMLEYDWKFTLADSDLPKVRAATRLADVSVGYPFLARELADFSLQLPGQWKVRRFTLRWFFKRALRDFLPREIVRKRKHGFGLPFGAWLLRHPPLRELVEDALRGVGQRGIVQPGIVRGILDTRLREAPGFYGELVWILTMLELWLRAHENEAVLPANSPIERQARIMAGEQQ